MVIILVNTLENKCIHYGQCGGCSLQHLDDHAYLEYKYNIFKNAIEQAGFADFKISNPIIVGPSARRRAQIKAIKSKNGVKLGYYQNKSHNIVDIKECPILHDDIVKIIGGLKLLLIEFDTGSYEFAITLVDNGLDILIKATNFSNLKIQEELVQFAYKYDISRISWQNNHNISPIIIRKTPQIKIANTYVMVAPDSFLQATVQSEKLIQEFIVAHSKNYVNIIDLYAGCGTYSFVMIEYAKVHAVEGNNSSIDAIKAASRGKENRITTELRDLYIYPLLVNELNKYQLSVINPPRNGAEPQVHEIGKSNINRVIMVSCNPKTLSRDLKILKNAGFTLTNSLAIDQFYWSNHLEIVAVLSRD
ncbi:23S rRNA (uracil-C(5))-methyltransferase RlmCD [Rickettsiales bacterium Ac37b]|nr:23S rRNA (uracil-C(5))-methyltransferase RlmCD [Rickettsiales bacterium Ac37b]